DMGMVFQSYSLFPNLSARDNVAFGLRVRRVATAERNRRAAELLDLVGLASTAGRYPHQLSGGQQQRVALARALAIQPSVLLLDEPLSALDAKVRVQLRDEIRRIQLQFGITTLYVTHDQEEALSVSDRVVVLSQGQIEQIGSPVEIYGSPRTVFVAQFVGTMNRIESTVPSHNQGGQGVVECGGIPLRVDQAREWPAGAHVLLLIRPESIEIDKLDDGMGVPDGSLEGTVTVRTFLGATTRLRVASAAGELMVDVGTARALTLGEDARVALTWDPAAARLLDLSDTGAPSTGAAIPPDASATAGESARLQPTAGS
ncbi:MAG: ABC transporter ATP-binding protein, partial [Chloroflexota bacterium]|nr:ABC transporter ATP-binding protein [Chloroflexota bacterium]